MVRRPPATVWGRYQRHGVWTRVRLLPAKRERLSQKVCRFSWQQSRVHRAGSVKPCRFYQRKRWKAVTRLVFAFLMPNVLSTSRKGPRLRPANGQIAQLVEHRTENPGVGGSIPPLPNPQRRGFRVIRKPLFSLSAAYLLALSSDIFDMPASARKFLHCRSAAASRRKE